MVGVVVAKKNVASIQCGVRLSLGVKHVFVAISAEADVYILGDL